MPAPLTQALAAGRGVTLLELMVTLAVLALLASLAVPAMGQLLTRRSAQAAAEALVADLRLARSEAIKRVAVVAVCSSTDGQACSSGAAWREGWMVFVDRDANRVRDAGEEVIRVQERPAGLRSIASSAPQNDKAIFSFHPTGWAKAASQTLQFTPQGLFPLVRVVCISSQGRASLRPEGMSECS